MRWQRQSVNHSGWALPSAARAGARPRSVDALPAALVTAWKLRKKPWCTRAPGYIASSTGASGAAFSLPRARRWPTGAAACLPGSARPHSLARCCSHSAAAAPGQGWDQDGCQRPQPQLTAQDRRRLEVARLLQLLNEPCDHAPAALQQWRAAAACGERTTAGSQ